MYTGQIYLDNLPLTVQEAVDLGYITVDANQDIWLIEDTMKVVKIQGDLRLHS
jgi:hypothetical protein